MAPFCDNKDLKRHKAELMFPQKLLAVLSLVAIVFANVVLISISAKFHHNFNPLERMVFFCISPFQEGVARTQHFFRDIWKHYFCLVSVSEENDLLKKRIEELKYLNSRYLESELANRRLRKILNFKPHISFPIVCAEVIGVDPSPWSKTVVINKGDADGVKKGMPVVVPEGIIGHVITVGHGYAKVLLIVDQNSAVDALVQRTRVRGIIKGEGNSTCTFRYALSKEDILIGDTVISSGVDGIFPKGLRVGSVRKVEKDPSEIFQTVMVDPFVDFSRLEEVMVIQKESHF